MYGATARTDVGKDDDAVARKPTPNNYVSETTAAVRRRPFATICALAIASLSGMCARNGVTDTIGVVQRALGAGTRQITFTVHTCGVPQDVWDGHVPWPVCRVKLVGCPGGGRSCYHWRYAEGLEMQANAARNTFTLTTSAYGTGDVFGFSVIEAGCNVADEAACDGNECKKDEACDHRYDSGTAHATNLASKTTNITCWEGERCSSKSPFVHPIRSHKPGGHECFTLMGEWWNRVVPPSTDSIEFVWGTCMHRPEDPAACAAASPPSVCTLLDTTAPKTIAREETCSSDNSVDGTVCRINHKATGYESFSVEGTCCDGKCCPQGQVCSRETRTCEDIKTVDAGEGTCADPDHEGITGVCTQSCGSGNGDCDLTCSAAAEDGDYELTCQPGDPNNKCICSNVGGQTANECKTSANPGWKCCTCKSLRRRGSEVDNGNGNSARITFPGSEDAGDGRCADPNHQGADGVCTQSCGTGNGDCDQTCSNARDVGGFRLSCTPGDPSNKCICSNVGGGTRDECATSENPGWKCCTCASIISSDINLDNPAQTDQNSNSNNNGGGGSNNNAGDNGNGKGKGA